MQAQVNRRITAENQHLLKSESRCVRHPGPGSVVQPPMGGLLTSKTSTEILESSVPGGREYAPYEIYEGSFDISAMTWMGI
ncbi:MAG: hypothetical protein R2854_08945 [Caldilineaceae bacterium]